MHWQTARFLIPLHRPLIMGIVNVTPDSFSDGGRHLDHAAAKAHCERLLAEGADILDIGGESTRPGSAAPSAQQECDRVLPVLTHALTLGVPVSVDTSEPELMRQALAMGADIINDVRALRRPGALATVAAHASAGVCLMHLRGEPDTMQSQADYVDVVPEVAAFLAGRVQAVLASGVQPGRIVLDPGIGFAKTDEHNFALARRQRELLALGFPLLLGWSRKRSLGNLTGRPVEDRLAASVAAVLAAVHNGASIVRVHDVAASVDALKVWRALNPLAPAAGATMSG